MSAIQITDANLWKAMIELAEEAHEEQYPEGSTEEFWKAKSLANIEKMKVTPLDAQEAQDALRLGRRMIEVVGKYST